MASDRPPPLRMADLLAAGPKETRTSEWLAVPQADIDAFGRLTRDPDPNHVDPDHARAHSPFGGPIAFGFQTLAMLTFLLKSAEAFPVDATHVVNYGFDRVRFVAPVPAGAAIRGRFRVDRVSERAPGEWQVEYEVEVDVQGGARPALVARWLALFQARGADCVQPSTLNGCVASWARLEPAREAAVEPGRRLSYAQLEHEVARWSAAMRAHGVGAGDRVAMLAPPGIDSLVCLLATVALGALWCGLDPRYRAQELAHRVADLEPRVVFAFARLGSRRGADEIAALRVDARSIEQLVEIGGEEGQPGARRADDRRWPLVAWLAAGATTEASPAAPPHVRSGETACLIVYTSGSSGVPKGALLHEAGILSFCRQQNERWPVQPLRTLNFLPISHAGSIVDLTLPVIVGGGCVVFQAAFDPLESLRAIERERVTFWASVPSTFVLQSARPEFAAIDLSSVQLIAIEGAAIPEQLASALARVAPIVTNYGMTETTSGITATEPTRSVGSLTAGVGRPYADIELRIAASPDSQGVGEIEVRSPRVCLGYWRAPQPSRDAFTPDGFFRTGDLGALDAEGRLRLVGRKREMFKSGGYNVYPAEIEALLEGDPGVAAAAVVPAPHDVWGEVGVAFVVARAGVEAGELRERLDASCRASLADYKRPKRVVFLEALPVLPIGKVDRQALRALAGARHA